MTEPLRLMRRTYRFFLLPALIYTGVFLFFTYPAILTFASHIWCGPGDGLQMVWNLWWFDKALVELHQQPWYTHYLHHPYGTHLLIHTFHPLKGLMAAALLPWMTIGQCYNILVIFSFVMGGITALWLAYSVSRSYWGSVVAGFVFSFSNYHFAHAQGHMQLISLEWIPLFVLCWLKALKSPSLVRGLLASGSLFLVLMCDHYYFFYCVMAGGLMVIWESTMSRDLLWIVRGARLRMMLGFLFLTLCTAGVFVGTTMIVMHNDPPVAFFAPSTFSMDVFALLIPGGHWRFNGLTEFYWSRVPGKIHGNSVHVGVAVLALFAYAWTAIRARRIPGFGVWVLLAAFFWIMALGPRLYLWGWEAPYIGDYEERWIKMPYDWLAAVVPPMKIGARPNRLVIMTILFLAIFVAMAIKMLAARGRAGRPWLLGAIVVMLIEYLPAPLPQFQAGFPEFVRVLAATEQQGAVFDPVTRTPLTMYYQTHHERPIAFGYISRTHESLHHNALKLSEVYEGKQYLKLRDDYGFRYLVTTPDADVVAHVPGVRLMTGDDERCLYDLGPPVASSKQP